MALNIRQDVTTLVTDTDQGISISQQKIVNDLAISGTLDLNYTNQTLLLPSGMTTWTLISKGDIAKIRDITLFLTTAVEGNGNIELLITDVVDPNSPMLDRTMLMREMFVGTVNLNANKSIWIKNVGLEDATLIAIFGGTNA